MDFDNPPRWYAIVRHPDGCTVRIGPWQTEAEARRELRFAIGRSTRLSGYVWHNCGPVHM